MTEERVERMAEAAMDRLDQQLMDGTLSEIDYDQAVISLDRWTQKMIDALT